MEVTSLSKKDQFLSAFDMLDFSFDADFSQDLRAEAKSKIQDLDFPTSKSEYWKYTRLNKILQPKYLVNAPIDESDMDLSIPSKNCLVFINGYFQEDLSWADHSEEFTFCSISEAKQLANPILTKHFARMADDEKEIFTLINTAYHQDGAFLEVKKNAKVDSSLYVLHITTGNNNISNPRNFIYLHENSEANVILKSISIGEDSTFSNMLSEVFVSANASLEINKIQSENEKSMQIAKEHVVQMADSRFKINTFTLGGSLVRNNLNINLFGQHTETWLNGLYPLKGKQHVDNHTFVYHREPNCVSHELYKGILDDESTGVFNGKVYVHRDAQKTNAYQSNANMVLTDNASANSKPELEIYADDVKCSHGSVTGQLDEEALFYLQSRGMSEKNARLLLLNAFASDVIDLIGVDFIQDEIREYFDKNFQTN